MYLYFTASIPAIGLVAGNLIVPTIMAKYGRQTANLISIIPVLVGWFCIIIADSIFLLLTARLLQGLCLGMTSSLGSVLIGEYTSPSNRGAFLAIISLSISIGVLAVHTMGSYLTWKTTALVGAVIAIINLVIVICSPESPSFLADQGRYEESKKAFRWLRGDNEEEELQRMIEAAIIVREAKIEVSINKSISKKMCHGFSYFGVSMKKKEFYKPIFIMIHLYILGQWSGAHILTPYAVDIFHHVVGPDVNVALMVIALDTQRIISNVCAVFVIRKVKRRTMLFVTVGINMFALIATAAYTYAKTHGMLPFDHPLIGVALIHILMFSIATGTVPLPFIIAGELFPLEYRSLAGGISVLFFSTNIFIVVKTVLFLFNTVGIYGAYCIYAGIVAYCMSIVWKFLPETKDRTLQDIEDEFRGRPLSPDELKSVESLTS